MLIIKIVILKNKIRDKKAALFLPFGQRSEPDVFF